MIVSPKAMLQLPDAVRIVSDAPVPATTLDVCVELASHVTDATALSPAAAAMLLLFDRLVCVGGMYCVACVWR